MGNTIPKPYPMYAPFPGAGFFRLGQKHPIVSAMGKRLVAEGYKGYPGGVSDKFTRDDIKAVAWFQRRQGLTGPAADGYPDKNSWKNLKVPQV